LRGTTEETSETAIQHEKANSATMNSADTRSNTYDIIRKRFVEEFKDDFVITEDYFKLDRYNKNIFWLVTVKPDKTGYFTIGHHYENRNSGMRYSENEYHISVAAKGSRRINSYNLNIEHSLFF